MSHLHDPVHDQCMFCHFRNVYYFGQHMNVETIFILYQYEPNKSNDESYRLVAETEVGERVYKGPHFEIKVRLEYISL